MATLTDVRKAPSAGGPVRAKRKIRIWAVLVGVIIGFFFLNLLALIASVVVDSLGTQWFGTWLPRGFTLHWYSDAWHEFGLSSVMVVTLEVAVVVVALSVVIGVPASYVLARSTFPGKRIVLLLFDAGVEDAKVVLSSGITCALSTSAAAAVQEAARRARTFIYDPNFRPRLMSAASAADSFRRLAPYAALVTPACPGETDPLFGCADPLLAARRARDLGARATAVTLGADGVLVDDGSNAYTVPAVAAPALVDQTGAGDSLVGTIAGRIYAGDSLLDAVRLGSAASSLCLQGQGGTGFVASLAQSRRHLERNGKDVTPLAAPNESKEYVA